jgi:Undecaprenyl-phosphate galactose phosphotransferase WbaP
MFAMLAIPFFRYFGKKLLLKLNIWSRPVILIGNDQTIPMIYGAFEREATMGYRVIGYILSTSSGTCGPAQKPSTDNPLNILPCLGTINNAEEIVRAAAVENLVIADPELTSAALVELTNNLQPLVKYITLVPDLFGVSLSGIEAAYFFEEQIVLLQIKNRLRSKISSSLKRTFDLVIGATISLLAFPLLIAIALAIKLGSTGPVFFFSKRIGRGGQEFFCIKFRTMELDCDQILEQYLDANDSARQEWTRYNKLITHDPRVTRAGHFLRRLSLDELPQLINIMRGEMSLVGPRPYLPREKEQMGSYAYDILVGKPGLTGLWQVSGRNKLTFNSRLKLDTWYMKNWSLWLDTVLLLKTIRVVMKRDGAY